MSVPIPLGMNPVIYPWRPLGDLLVGRGLIAAEQLEEALHDQRRTGRRLGEVLVAKDMISAEDLTAALAEQCGLQVELEAGDVQARGHAGPSAEGDGRPWRPLGQVLVERGALTKAELRDALAEQGRQGLRLGEVLLGAGYVTGPELVSAVAEQHGLGEPNSDKLATAVVSTQHAGGRDESEEPSGPAEPAYEVHVLDRSGRERTLLFRTESFLDATDFAFEILGIENPERLEILRYGGPAESEAVWGYDAREAAEIAAQSRDLVDVYGFDVTRWTGPPSNAL